MGIEIDQMLPGFGSMIGSDPLETHTPFPGDPPQSRHHLWHTVPHSAVHRVPPPTCPSPLHRCPASPMASWLAHLPPLLEALIAAQLPT